MIGYGVSVEQAKKNVDSLRVALEFAQRDVVRAEHFEAWQKAHPGVVPEG
jgi:CO/xanthine dehydrogenase FAD-binding subunit